MKGFGLGCEFLSISLSLSLLIKDMEIRGYFVSFSFIVIYSSLAILTTNYLVLNYSKMSDFGAISSIPTDDFSCRCLLYIIHD
jgi:hypothetical protein